ncbi:MAG TPA: protein-methionine-sulfoxide reductase heme-binding subunit MsrQ [Gammaproteobacteria bacterium]|nr:protein-methionine-sulfoxide reductase heme-binding subunit MsrQ [Gammaproteobacteria bacterium]
MNRRRLAWLKAGIVVAGLVPLAQLGARAFGIGDLGANPVQHVQHTLGTTALNLLLLTLTITPLRRLTGQNWLVALRRSIGLLAFAYAALHATSYVALDQRFNWPALLVDVTERPWITVGFLALALLVPLAVTSTNAMQRRLGRRWTTLHRTIYVIAVLGVLHFFWQVKLDTSEPLLYALALAALLGFRVVDWARRRRPARRARAQ